MTSRRPLIAAVAAGAVALAGCGASGASSAVTAQVRHTVSTALADLAAGNGRALCAMVTPAGRATLTRQFPRDGCAAAVRAVSADMSAAHRRALAHVTVGKVTISHHRATVSSDDISSAAGKLKGFLDDEGEPTTLIRQPNGSWLIGG